MVSSHNHPASHTRPPPQHASDEASARLAAMDPPAPSFDLSASNTRPAPVLLLALSGPSSSGKTTLARLLRDILPNTYILHLDDFYKHDTQIPVNAAGIQDWDCLEAIDMPPLRNALAHIRAHGSPPPDFVSKEDKNAVGDCRISDNVVRQCKQRIETFFKQPGVEQKWGGRKIAIIDGFLLYSKEMAEQGIRDQFDVKLFLRTSYVTAKRRREARSGYVTLEGFWEDPPGYVDDIVWPNYVKDHKFLFKGEDAEGEIDEDVCRQIGVEAMPKDAAEDMGKVLEWATQVILDSLARVAGP